MQNDTNDPNKKEDNKDKIIRKKKAIIGYQLGLILHMNFGYHVLLLTIINFLVGGIVVGLSSRFYPIIQFESIESFVVAMLLFTSIEVFIKGLMVRYLYRFVLMTFGLMFYLSNLLSFYLVDLSISQISFLYNGSNIFAFTFIFMMIRLLFTTYVRKSKWIQKGASHGL